MSTDENQVEHEPVEPAEPAVAAPKVDLRRRARVNGFDPKRPPENGFTHKLPEAEWVALHGDDPMSVRELRGRVRLERVAVHKLENGHCATCGAKVVVVDGRGVAACLGCGQIRENN